MNSFKKNWDQDLVSVSCISEEELKSKLMDSGWTFADLTKSFLLNTKNFSFWRR